MPILTPRTEDTTLDGNGNGQVAFSIDNTNAWWYVDEVRVLTLTAPGGTITTTPVPVASTYLNLIEPQAFKGGTYSGNFDQATGRAVLYEGDVLYVTWTGGVPGSFAIAIIEGTYGPAGSAPPSGD